MANTDDAHKSENVGIIGSGLIGRSFAMLFAAAGYRPCIYDIKESQLDDALADTRKQLADLEKHGLLRGSLSAAEQHERISTTNDLAECVSDVFYIQECVYEREELKRSVWEKVDPMVGENTILASSASAIVPSKLSEGLVHRNNFIVVHPTNPPFYAPLVEIIPAPWTEAGIVQKVKALMTELGQSPVVLKKEIEGFVLNRIQYSIIGEYMRLLKEGIMSVEDLDKVMTDGLGVRYAFNGPLMTAYLNAEGFYEYGEKYRDMIFGIQKSFGEPIKMEGDILKQMQDEITRVVPMDAIHERRAKRDLRLTALSKLKKEMDRKDSENS